MTNPVRGECVLKVEGVGDFTLVLNMGALARIERELGCTTIQQLINRMVNMGVNDMMVILHALLVAGGNPALTIEDIGRWPTSFTSYTDAIQQTLVASGFIQMPKTNEEVFEEARGSHPKKKSR